MERSAKAALLWAKQQWNSQASRTSGFSSEGSCSAMIREWSEEAFPMMVVSLAAYLETDVMQPHGTLREEGLLEEVGPDDDFAVHFVSHEWLSQGHPDPEGFQLWHLKRFFHALFANDGCDTVFSPEDWTTFATGTTARGFREGRLAVAKARRQTSGAQSQEEDCGESNFGAFYLNDVRQGRIWIDFASIPQLTKGMGRAEVLKTKANQMRAIQTIPKYVERADYFYVLAPACRKQCGALSDFNSWRRRGWCRAEEFFNFLSQKHMTPLVITEGQRVIPLEFWDYHLFCTTTRDRSTFNGEFSCCSRNHRITQEDGRVLQIPCDKDLLAPVVARMFDVKLDTLRAQGNEVLHRVYQCVEPAFLAGSALDRCDSACPAEETVEDFMARFNLPAGPPEVQGATVRAVRWAAGLGHLHMLRKLLALDPELADGDTGGLRALVCGVIAPFASTVTGILISQGNLTEEAINRGTGNLGITALHHAATGGDAQVVQLLLAARADTEARRRCGRTPLLSAAQQGHEAVCRCLLQSRSDVLAKASDGSTALHLAARKFSFVGVPTADRGRVATLLVASRADPRARDALGRMPVEAAHEEGNSTVVEALDRLRSVASL